MDVSNKNDEETYLMRHGLIDSFYPLSIQISRVTNMRYYNGLFVILLFIMHLLKTMRYVNAGGIEEALITFSP